MHIIMCKNLARPFLLLLMTGQAIKIIILWLQTKIFVKNNLNMYFKDPILKYKGIQKYDIYNEFIIYKLPGFSDNSEKENWESKN